MMILTQVSRQEHNDEDQKISEKVSSMWVDSVDSHPLVVLTKSPCIFPLGWCSKSAGAPIFLSGLSLARVKAISLLRVKLCQSSEFRVASGVYVATQCESPVLWCRCYPFIMCSSPLLQTTEFLLVSQDTMSDLHLYPWSYYERCFDTS